MATDDEVTYLLVGLARGVEHAKPKTKGALRTLRLARVLSTKNSRYASKRGTWTAVPKAPQFLGAIRRAESLVIGYPVVADDPVSAVHAAAPIVTVIRELAGDKYPTVSYNDVVTLGWGRSSQEVSTMSSSLDKAVAILELLEDRPMSDDQRRQLAAVGLRAAHDPESLEPSRLAAYRREADKAVGLGA